MGGVLEDRDVHLHLAFIPDPEHCDHHRTCEVMRDFQNVYDTCIVSAVLIASLACPALKLV